MTIAKRHKDETVGCIDCHGKYASLKEYPCVIYKICPMNAPGRFYLGKNGNGKQIRACLLIGKDCACAQ